MPLTQQSLLQSLTSVPPPLVCTEVCVPPIQQDLLVVPITQLFLAEFDQCASSPCMHGDVCASHPTGPVCNCTGTGYGGRYCHTSKYLDCH